MACSDWISRWASVAVTSRSRSLWRSVFARQGRYRSLWEQYYRDAQAIIFVVDSTDKIRACVAKVGCCSLRLFGDGPHSPPLALVQDELESMLKHAEIATKRIPVLFFANKVRLGFTATPVRCVCVCDVAALCPQMDLPGAMEPPEVMASLGLASIADKPWHIQCAVLRCPLPCCCPWSDLLAVSRRAFTGQATRCRAKASLTASCGSYHAWRASDARCC